MKDEDKKDDKDENGSPKAISKFKSSLFFFTEKV